MSEPDQAGGPTTLKGLQGCVDHWIQSIGVRYFSPLSNLAQLTEEVGELARAMNRTYGDQSRKPGEIEAGIADELADVLFVVTCLANQCGVDLQEAIAANLRKKTLRDSARHRDNPKLADEFGPGEDARSEPNQPSDKSERRTT